MKDAKTKKTHSMRVGSARFMMAMHREVISDREEVKKRGKRVSESSKEFESKREGRETQNSPRSTVVSLPKMMSKNMMRASCLTQFQHESKCLALRGSKIGWIP